MNILVQYVAAALLNSANSTGSVKAKLSRFSRDHYEQYAGSTARIVREIQGQFGTAVTEQDVADALNLLQPFAAAEMQFSPATNGFWSIKFDNFRYYFIESEPDPGDDASIYAELRAAAEQLPILISYAQTGSAYVEDAIEHISQMNADQLAELRSVSTMTAFVPAADRTVTLSHNQQIDLERTSTELIDAVEKENSLDGDTSLRVKILGQLKAGRELIRAQTLNAYLLHLTLVGALGTLIERYKGSAIAVVAKKLLEMLVEAIFGK